MTQRFQFKGFSKPTCHFGNQNVAESFATIYAENLQAAITQAERDSRSDWKTVQDADGNYLMETFAGEWMTIAEAEAKRSEIEIPSVF